MKRPAVFFDRDNTLIVSDGYLGDPAEVALVDGAAEAVARVRAMGFSAVTFSNQSGVARGMFGEEAVHAVNSRLDDLLHEDNPAATIDRHEFCPYHPDAAVPRYRQDSDLRKPKPGMIYQAAQKLGLDLSRSWAIGDAPRDISAGRAAGCHTILLKIPGLPPSAASEEPAEAQPDFTAGSLAEAIELIERHAKPPVTEPDPPAAVESAESTASVTEITPQPTPANVSHSEEFIAPASPPLQNSATNHAEPEAPADGFARPGLTWGERMRAARDKRTAPGSAESPQAVSSSPEPAEDAAPVAPLEHQPMNQPEAAVAIEPPAEADTQPPAPMRESEPQPAPAPAPTTTRRAENVRTVRPTAAARETETTTPARPDLERLERIADQILQELRQTREHAPSDFSISKLFAGILQVLTLATFVYAYFVYFVKTGDNATVQTVLMLAIALETVTIALLIMGRQK